MSKIISGPDVDFIWVDDECACIRCPYCGKEIYISIYRDMADKCTCGKRFILGQRFWVEEIE